MTLPLYNVKNWYWIVSDMPHEVYSSATNTFVPNIDPTYLAWKRSGGIPVNIVDLAELTDALTRVGLPPPPDDPRPPVEDEQRDEHS